MGDDIYPPLRTNKMDVDNREGLICIAEKTRNIVAFNKSCTPWKIIKYKINNLQLYK